MYFVVDLKVICHQRGPNLFFKYFYFPFWIGLFYPLRVLAKVKFFWQFNGIIDSFAPKMKLLR